MADRATQRRLGDAMGAALPLAGTVWRFDQEGPALYQLEPTWATMILCPACEFVTLVPSLPRVLELVHECSACRRRIRLRPPFDVLAAAPPSSPVKPPAPN